MYVRAYLAIPCVSANDNVKHRKSNMILQENQQNEINVKYIRIHVYEYKKRMFASNFPYRDRKPKYISKFWKKHGGDGKQAMAPCALAFLPPGHRDATTPSPCWASHFITKERIMFSNPTSSGPRLSPAAMMSDDMLSALTPPLHCVSILKPATPPQNIAFESWTISAPICLYRFTF